MHSHYLTPMSNPSILHDALLAADNARIADDEASWEELLWHLNALAEEEAAAADADYWASQMYPIA
jgi:hypothetical protein